MGIKLSKLGLQKPSSIIPVDPQHYFIHYLAKSSFIHRLVSKKRRRMLVGGYDLDMSYITDHILAMSFPAERMRAAYRNPLWQVKSVLDMRHDGNYKVFNLCIEEAYDPSNFHGRVERYPFDDNNVPALEMIKLFCESVGSWLSRDPKNIAVIHCMAGKGRTGLMVCSYLVYCGMSADEALHLYAQRRTTNNEGVTIPSQRRYVRYWADMVSFPKNRTPVVSLPQRCSRELRHIRLYDTVNTDSVFFVVSEFQEISNQLYRPPVELARGCCRQIKRGYHRTNSHQYYISFNEDSENEKKTASDGQVVQMDTERPILYHKSCLDFYFDKPLQVTGDVRVIFYQKLIGLRLFYVCFNTAFTKNSLLQFSVSDLDKTGTRGKSICGPAFCLELLFGPANTKGSLVSISDDEAY